ncbi:MAG: protease family protein [Thermoanaerobaculia bacterium]|nr:protease family protein [Thermoanaerobaculia bacterium]
MTNIDDTDAHRQHVDADSRPAAANGQQIAQLFAALSLFAGLYLAALFVSGYLTARVGIYRNQWVMLISVIVATIGAVGIMDDGVWHLGFFVRPRLATREFLLGCVAAILLIASADGLVLLSTKLHHVAGNGFPWIELMTIYLPAVFHEEILFRGYPFQKLWKANRLAAVLLMSFVFAALHGRNSAISWLALINLFLAGILLALAYARYERLWFPIGIHLGWNLLSGPVLGYNVSGFIPSETVWKTVGRGTPWLTGGLFGIEGSVWIAVVELAGIVLLLRSGKIDFLRGPRVSA